MKKTIFLLLAACFLLLSGCRRPVSVDPLLRSHADGLNKEAFRCRYREPDRCLALSRQALAFVRDSLPTYADGEVRALNNMAFAHYQMSEADSAKLLLDEVGRLLAAQSDHMANAEVEQVISSLLRARLLQRECRIADSYRLLYGIGRSRILDRNQGNVLFSYAQTEYYITMLVLNYHYRDGKDADVRTLLDEVERRRPELQVDYAQDMALNYALAYGWQSAGESLTALEYCDDNLRLLDLPGTFCPYNYANTLQMMASALKSMPGRVSPDSVLALYDEARRVFFDYGDPYQMLGGTTSTARYALLCADTAAAHEVLDQWRALRGTWKPFTAPKMETGYFDVMIRSRYGSSTDEIRRWYERRSQLLDYIARNEHEDFVLQQTLADATRRSRWMTVTAIVVATMMLALALLTALLWHSLRRLRREKQQLEEAKRRDVERIANVETCLSVMRHDVSPFVGYLRSPNLTPELRDEVLGQLLRTFDNIKGWTSLSIPSGLVFSASTFPLQTVFDDVSRQVVSPAAGVTLRFADTDLQVWGDRLLVTILLRNLVNNALQHTTEGNVAVYAAQEETMVHVTVADTGCGMTPDQVEALFRADRPSGDHGFGLILCRYIVKKHDDNTRRGCKIWAESTPGQGSRMHCLLATPRP